MMRWCSVRALVFLAVLSMPAVPMHGENFNVLLFTKTAGFRHASIPDAVTAFQQLAATNNFSVTNSENSALFTDAGLAPFRVIVFLMTTGDVLDASQQAAMERFIRAGNGFVGVHSASDTEYSWPWYGGLVGAYFANHGPGTPTATIRVEDSYHASTRFLPTNWVRADEWYNFQSNPRSSVHVLATVDESTFAGGTMGDHPIAWCHDYDGGRSWYTGCGHTAASYSEPLFRQHLLGGLLYAAGQDSFSLRTIREDAKVVVTWPTNASGFVLQHSVELGSSAHWTNYPGIPALVNGQYAITNDISDPGGFFRLRRYSE